MTQGSQLCMDCHGSVVSGKERREVWDDVSCQSCHGAAADYLEPHKEGAAADGARRKGYLDPLQLGMVELQNVDTRAERCAAELWGSDQGRQLIARPAARDLPTGRHSAQAPAIAAAARPPPSPSTGPRRGGLRAQP